MSMLKIGEELFRHCSIILAWSAVNDLDTEKFQKAPHFGGLMIRRSIELKNDIFTE
jgi:hypothetical protein